MAARSIALKRVLISGNAICFYHEEHEGLEEFTVFTSFIIFMSFMVIKTRYKLDKGPMRHCYASALIGADSSKI
jgi:hypothetical protein